MGKKYKRADKSIYVCCDRRLQWFCSFLVVWLKNMTYLIISVPSLGDACPRWADICGRSGYNMDIVSSNLILFCDLRYTKPFKHILQHRVCFHTLPAHHTPIFSRELRVTRCGDGAKAKWCNTPTAIQMQKALNLIFNAILC